MLMTKTADRLLANIREWAPSINWRAGEIEAGRQMPPDLVGALRAIGVYRMFVPQSYGRLELDLPAGLEIIRALGRIDGSVGWIAMIGSGHGIWAPLLPRNTYEQVYQNGPDVIIAGSTHPVGTAEATAGHLRVHDHTAVANELGPTRSFLGFFVTTDYWETPAHPRLYDDLALCDRHVL